MSTTPAPAPLRHSRQQYLSDFVAWSRQHISGDEKGQSQIFLDRLLQAFGQRGALDAGGTLEYRVRNDDGGTSFADYVWKPRVLIEMKKRGANLAHHYRQALDYWTFIAPHPRYVVLCNFDEFWIYDFEEQMDTPKDRVSLAELPERNGALAFLSPLNERPVFAYDQVQVTRDAADKLADCYKSIAKRESREDSQAFILQMLVALFAEDIGLLEQYTVTRILEECKSKSQSYDLIGGLFSAMNEPRSARGGRYKSIPYFNGGLFAKPARIELADNEINLLKAAAAFEWSNVRPEIFGTLFEHSFEKKERHAFGQHFTSHADIMKIVRPTIVEPWREQIEKVKSKSLTELNKLLNRLQHFTVLDPACGSGNFLYLAYRELKRLEKQLLTIIEERFPSETKETLRMTFLSPLNFFGLDISPLAIELAKVTLCIARKLAIDELKLNEDPLPFQKLEENLQARDALIDENGLPSVWPKTDVIIGNPPFLGAKRLKPERGPDYVNAVRKAYPDVPGMVDYCVYWFRKAHDQLPKCTAADPVAGRAGLVGTQNIRNNQSRVGGLDHVVKEGTIIEAVDNQPWSGEANVHVSIANWIETNDAAILPATRKLWYKIEPDAGVKSNRKRGSGSAAKQFNLGFRDCSSINSSLSDKCDVSNAKVLDCNTIPQRVFQGVTPGHAAFVLHLSQANEFVSNASENADVIYPYLIGDEILAAQGTPDRFILDFQQRSLIEAKAYEKPFSHVEKFILPARRRAAEEGKDDSGKMRPHHKQFLERWWKLSWDRADMIAEISKRSRFMVCSRVTKRPIFIFVAQSIRPGDALQVFVFDDDYSFGILQSNMHWQWFITKCSKLTERFRYTPDSVFDTFPWPQSPTPAQISAVAAAGREIRRVREQALHSLKGGLRALYRTLELPGKNPLKDAHAALDAAVLDAYGFSPAKDLLAQILALNLEVAARIERHDPVTSPGIPPTFPNPATLITTDCIRPAEE